MVLLWALAALAAPPPVVELSWRGEVGALAAAGGPGEHVAPDAPADLELRWSDRALALETTGADLAAGLPVWGVRGAEVEGLVRLSLCTDDGRACRPVELTLRGVVPDARKGAVLLQVAAASDPPAEAASAPEASPYRADARAAYDSALRAAQASGRMVLLDFTAVWCPPCMLMADEVLDLPAPPAALGRFVVVRLDADDPSSFPIKARYDVGGYPTVVAIRPDGAELSRVVGYPGADALVGWIERVVGDGPSDAERVASGPAAATPEQAGEIAWMLLRQGAEDVDGWLERASASPDALAFRKARLASAPTLEDLRWLDARDAGSGLDWLFEVDVDGLDGGPDALRAALSRRISLARGADAADLLYLSAQLAEGADAELLYGAAAASLRGALVGDPQRDKPHLGFLATLLERSGRADQAVALLDVAAADFPDEPTFLLSSAGLLLRAGRPEDALDHAERALPLSWGDNRIRVAILGVKARLALGRPDEARAFARGLDLPRPSDELEVRTHRYLKELEGLLE